MVPSCLLACLGEGRKEEDGRRKEGDALLATGSGSAFVPVAALDLENAALRSAWPTLRYRERITWVLYPLVSVLKTKPTETKTL
jgi:hypothetical protein